MLVMVSVLFVIFFVFVLMASKSFVSKKVISGPKDKQESSLSSVGVLGEEVNSKIFVEQTEKDYYELKQNLDEVSHKTSADIEKLSNDQKFIGEYLEDRIVKRLDKIEKQLQDSGEVNKILKTLNLNNLSQGLLNQPSQSMTLEHVDILPIDKAVEKDKFVHLPMGSYCRGTLLTGVHAPSDNANPLPVLVRLDEAFIGPNQTKVPLKGTFILGSAYGDIASRRAYIEVYGLSTVLPDGRSFEKNMPSIGYIGDISHHFGVEGKLVNPTAKELGISFLAGFMSGTSQAFADAETTSVASGLGTVTKSVTGDSTKNATFQGLAKSAANLSDHYQKEIDKIIPSIWIDSGTIVYFYVQKGITIDGLKLDDRNQINYVD